MTGRVLRSKGKPALDLIEEAIGLLRSAPASTFLIYYIGALPFWIVFLYFVTDMSHSAFAVERLTGSSLGLVVAFIWMKCWQAVFSSRLKALLFLEDDAAWTASRAAAVIVEQTKLQPLGLLLRPFAVAITIPVVWVSAFFQNVTILGDGQKSNGKSSVFARAWRQAMLWPGQAHILTTLLFIFGFFIWCNIASAFFVAPSLLKMFLGIETEASRNIGVLVNSTAMSAIFAVTMLCIDPVIKAVFLLRCFYGDSIRTGQDLRVRLRKVQQGISLLILAAALALIPMGADAAAELPVQQIQEKAVDAAQLNRSIDGVLQRREYAWRTPHKQQPAAEAKGGWLEDVVKWLREKLRSARKLWEKFLEWLFGRKSQTPEVRSGAPLHLREFAYGLIGVIVLVIAVAMWRRLRNLRLNATPAEALPALPDLHAEEITADQLPEDGWLDLMRKALAEGQRRVAVRAAYLATLAHLGHRQMLTIARSKSNRDYNRELSRRARGQARLLGAFEGNLSIFERAWYGRHEVSDAMLEEFTRNLEVIRAC